MNKKTEEIKFDEFKVKDVEDYDCYIDMSIEQAIRLVDAFLEKYPTGDWTLDNFARRVAIHKVNEELKNMMFPFG